MCTSSRLKGLFALLLPTACLIGLVLFSSKGLATHAATVPVTNALRATQNLTRWSIVSSPNPGTADNFLNGVATISTNDVWAVGHYTNSGSGYTETLTEHWDGTSWSVIPSQNPEPESILNGVAAVSTNDVWAVGYQQITNTALTLIEHWDGVSWSVIPSPNVTSQENILTRVVVVSTSDVWAVGYDNTGNPFENQTLIEHWDGTQWRIVPSQSPAAVNNVLMGVTAIAAGNIWAVGSQDNNGSCPDALIEHWNGKSWQVVTNPNQCNSQLMDVVAIASKNVWAVGRDTAGQPLIDHWNGTSWSLKAIPNATSVDNSLIGLARVPGTTQVWAIGAYYGSANYYQTLTEFRS